MSPIGQGWAARKGSASALGKASGRVSRRDWRSEPAEQRETWGGETRKLAVVCPQIIRKSILSIYSTSVGLSEGGGEGKMVGADEGSGVGPTVGASVGTEVGTGLG